MRRERVGLVLGLVLDLAIGSVIASSAVVALAAVCVQHRFDHDSAAIADLLRRDGAPRVALPFAMRTAVRVYRDRGIEPLLYDPTTIAVQAFARHDVDHVVLPKEGFEALASFASATARVGSTTLVTVDTDAVRSAPLAAGQSISWEYSRPYRYAPISDSLLLGKSHWVEYAFELATGRYQFDIEAFSDTAEPLEFSILEGRGARRGLQYIPRLSYGPISMRFSIARSEDPVLSVTIALQHAWGEDARGDIRLHRAELARIE